MEKPLFENIIPSRMEPPPWVWDRVKTTLATAPTAINWAHRLVPAALVASLFLAMGTFETHRINQNNVTTQYVQHLFAPESEDILATWDI